MAVLPLGDGDLDRVEELAALGNLDLASVIDLLPAHEREAGRARVIDERDYHDIAGELECSESVARQRVSRGLARARTRLTARARAEDRP